MFGPPSPRQQLPSETGVNKPPSGMVSSQRYTNASSLHHHYYTIITSSLLHHHYIIIITSSLHHHIQAPTDVYGLLLPNKSDSSANKTKPHPPESRDDHMTSDDITAMTSDPSITRRERGRERRRNRESVIVGTDDGGHDVKVWFIDVCVCVCVCDCGTSAGEVRVQRWEVRCRDAGRRESV